MLFFYIEYIGQESPYFVLEVIEDDKNGDKMSHQITPTKTDAVTSTLKIPTSNGLCSVCNKPVENERGIMCMYKCEYNYC